MKNWSLIIVTYFLHLLRRLYTKTAICELSVRQLLFLDVLGVEVEVELVQVVYAAAELLPALVIAGQEVGLPLFQHLGQLLNKETWDRDISSYCNYRCT